MAEPIVDFSSSLGQNLNLTANTAEVTNEVIEKQDNPLYMQASDNSVFNTLRRPRKIAGGGVLQYPIDLDTDIQDYFEIQIFKYRAAKRLPRINEDVENAAGGIYARSNLRGLRQNQRLQDLQSTIQLPIPNSVKDQNAVGWGGGEMSGVAGSILGPVTDALFGQMTSEQITKSDELMQKIKNLSLIHI